VLRGGVVEHPRYAGKRILGAGLNLTHLYQGKISYLFFPVRDLGFVNKVFRGDKLWIAAAETYAIGGACQLLLAVDHIIAEEGCRLTLPARNEGIIPGAANLRLPRFVGDRAARRAILSGEELSLADMADEIVAPGEMDAAIEARAAALSSSGAVSGSAKPARVPGRAGAAGPVPRVHGRVRARAGALLLLARADPQPRAQLARAREGGVILDAIESASRDELETLQASRLRATLRRRGLDGELRDLPFTVKDGLARGVSARADRGAALGAGAHPRVLGHGREGHGGRLYASRSGGYWTQVMARALYGAGVRPGMVVHNAYGYGLFTGGLGFHQGAERLGATVVPVSGGLTARQVMLLRDLRAQVLCCTPSYALHIAESGVEDLRLEVGPVRRRAVVGGDASGAGVAVGARCAETCTGCRRSSGRACRPSAARGRDGSHVQEDHFLVEVIDPASGDAVPQGELGELVFTTLTKEALPLIRYRTGDIASVDASPCVCGRTTARMGPGARAPRRHAHHPRREPLSVAGRARAARGGGHRAALAARGLAPGPAGRGDRALRAGRRPRRPRRARQTRAHGAARGDRRRHRRRVARAGGGAAKRGQGRPRSWDRR